jgi:ribulose-5-phosphate 4-epimerase/fuculose-1-phosphate aldolase
VLRLQRMLVEHLWNQPNPAGDVPTADDSATEDDLPRGARPRLPRARFRSLADIVWGHVSIRSADGTGFWLKGGSIGLDEVTADDVLLVDYDGNVRWGTLPLHHEWPIHAEILRAQRDLRSVVHVHPRHAIALGATDEPLRPISHEAMRWSPPDVPRFTLSADLITTPELGRAVAECMGARDGVLLRNHGVAVGGPDVATACLMTVFLERACSVQLLAIASGASWFAAPDDQAVARRAQMNEPVRFEKAWTYYRRRLAH